MSAIAAAAMRVRTMADGSLRIECEVEPNDAQAAFALFGRPGAPMAIAALTPGYAMPKDEPQEEPKPPIGDLCKCAVIWGKDPEFWNFINSTFAGYDPVRSEKDAESVVKFFCSVDSRRELDTDPDAKALFLRCFQAPYQRWRIARGNA